MSQFIDRYLSGEHLEVWDDLLVLGSAVRAPEYMNDALAVARETMTRVKNNLTTLVSRLHTVGYLFQYEIPPHPPFDISVIDDEQFWDNTPLEGREEVRGYIIQAYQEELAALARNISPPLEDPGENNMQLRDKLEQSFGSLPLSVFAWFECIGEVNFVGKCPPNWIVPIDQSHHDLDPIVIVSLEELLHEDHYLQRGQIGQLSISPHEIEKGLGKYKNGYGISIPNQQIDSFFYGEWHYTTFVQYLRKAISWGGLPGLEHHAIPQDILIFLREGLIPF